MSRYWQRSDALETTGAPGALLSHTDLERSPETIMPNSSHAMTPSVTELVFLIVNVSLRIQF